MEVKIMIVVSVLFLALALYFYKKKEKTGDLNLGRSNGSGTGLYGKADYDPSDRSYTATKWFVILLIPLFPLGSYRVIKHQTKDALFPGGLAWYGKETTYKMKRVSLNWRQVTLTYLVTFLVIGLIFYFLRDYLTPYLRT